MNKPGDAIEISNQGTIREIDPSTVIGILSDIEGVEDALRANNFDQQELVNILISHVRDVDPKVSASGIDRLLKYLKETALNGGLFTQHSIERTQNDGTSRTTQRLQSTAIARLRSRAPSGESTLHDHTYRPAVIAGDDSDDPDGDEAPLLVPAEDGSGPEPLPSLPEFGGP